MLTTHAENFALQNQQKAHSRIRNRGLQTFSASRNLILSENSTCLVKLVLFLWKDLVAFYGASFHSNKAANSRYTIKFSVREKSDFVHDTITAHKSANFLKKRRGGTTML